jgi:hypothetical protein
MYNKNERKKQRTATTIADLLVDKSAGKIKNRKING